MNWWTLQQLKFKNPQTRKQAIEKLAVQPPADAVPGLLSAIEDEAAEVRSGPGNLSVAQQSCLRRDLSPIISNEPG